MATTQQKRAMNIKLQKIKENKPVRMGEVMVQAGYSPTTAKRPQDLTQSKGWQELKVLYLDDELALKTLSDLADGTNDDKDNRLKASTEILKLNDRYPAQKSKILGLFHKIEDLEE